MKFSRFLCLILCLILLLCPALQASGAETAPSTAQGCHSVDASIPLDGTEKRTDTATAAVLYERSTGTLLYAYNADSRIYPSSMVKLMTVIVALEQGDLDATVTVTQTALNAMGIGVSSAGLVRGEELSLRDLLYCVMVASANDAATVVAEHIGGSQSGFVSLMNEKAESIGCTDTNFTNVHGLHDSNCYTTVRDVLRILEYGLQNPEFKTMFEASTYTLAATNKNDARQIETTNSMALSGTKYYDERVTGGRTGYTDAAGRCLAVTAQVGNMELVGIVMGAGAEYEEYADGTKVLKTNKSFVEMAELLDYAQKTFTCVQLYYTGQVIAQYTVDNGSNNAVATPVSDGFCVLPKTVTAQDLTWKYDTAVTGLAAPISAGHRITGMEVWYGDICLATTELVAIHGVSVYEPYQEPQSAVNRKEEQDHGALLARILAVVLGVTVAFLLGRYLFRLARVAVLRAQIRKRRKNRRRNRNA